MSEHNKVELPGLTAKERQESLETPLTPEGLAKAIKYIEKHKTMLESGETVQMMIVSLQADGTVTTNGVMSSYFWFIFGRKIMESRGTYE